MNAKSEKLFLFAMNGNIKIENDNRLSNRIHRIQMYYSNGIRRDNMAENFS